MITPGDSKGTSVIAHNGVLDSDFDSDNPPEVLELTELVRSVHRLGEVSKVLTGFAYLRHLARLRRRATSGFPLFDDPPPERGTPAEPVEHKGRVKRRPPLPYARPWETLRTCVCARCGLIMLGASDEIIRERAKAGKRRGDNVGRKGGPLDCLPLLPPPIAMWAGGRPYCERCVDLPTVPTVQPIRSGCGRPTSGLG